MRLWQALLQRQTLLGATFNGQQLYTMGQSWRDGEERLPSDFTDYVQQGYKSNGVVFACMLARIMLFSEVEFIYQRLNTKDLFGDPSLTPLENPWPNGSTGELVAHAVQDVDLAGNFYARIVPNGLERMRPDWVQIVSMRRNPRGQEDPSGRREVIGYTYTEGGIGSSKEPIFYPVEEVIHWSPIPDPEHNFIGMSWLTPVAREILGDTAMSRHKNKFFDNAATPNMVIATKQKLQPDQRDALIAQIHKRHEGLDNAYKTMLVDGGADVTVVGLNFEQMAFALTQGAGENRICVASGVPAIVVGLKEGLQAATYSNYGQAMRRFADITARPSWRTMAAAFQKATKPPAGTRLWYDDRRIPALQESAKDAADVMAVQATSITALTQAGYDADAVVAAVLSGDLSKLSHSGLFSVQLQPAGVNGTPAKEGASSARSVLDEKYALELERVLAMANNGHQDERQTS